MSQSPSHGSKAAPSRRGRSVRTVAGIVLLTLMVLPLGWLARAGWFSTRAVSAAVTVEPARVRISAALLDETVRRSLPLEVVVAASVGAPADAGVPSPVAPAVVSLTELRYCGVTEKGNGRWRAVLRSMAGGGGTIMSPLLSSDDACRQGLGELSKGTRDREEGEDGVGIGEVEGVWRGWELHLVLARVSGLGPSKPGGPRPLAVLDNRRDLLVIPTANLRVPTDGGELLTFHAAIAFAADGVEVGAFFGENGSGPPGGRIPPSAGHGAPIVAGANLSADLPQGFVNSILRQLTASRPLAISVDRDVIDIQSVSVAGSAAGFVVTGLATPHSVRETFRLIVQTGGDELAVVSIRGEAQLESCAGMTTVSALGCSARNAARNAGAAALGAALTQKFQGRLLRELAGTQTLRFDFARHRIELRGDLTRVAAGGRSTTVGANLAVGRGVGH